MEAFALVRANAMEELRRYKQVHLTARVYKVVMQKSAPAQIRQLVLHISNDKGYVDGFAWELTFATRLYKQCM